MSGVFSYIVCLRIHCVALRTMTYVRVDLYVRDLLCKFSLSVTLWSLYVSPIDNRYCETGTSLTLFTLSLPSSFPPPLLTRYPCPSRPANVTLLRELRPAAVEPQPYHILHCNTARIQSLCQWQCWGNGKRGFCFMCGVCVCVCVWRGACVCL